MLLLNYYTIFLFLLFSCILSFIIFALSYSVSVKEDDGEKLTAYECGFNPFNDSRNEFDVRFYIVAILFLIFDLEISFLYPFVVSINNNSIIEYFVVCFFLFLLTIGFLYE